MVPLFRATSELVLLDVEVVDNKTNTVRAAQLEPKDLEVWEDGVSQKILYSGRDQLPLSMVLLFDLTQSDRRVLHRMAADAQTALDHLKPEDEAAVMVYAAGTRLIDGFTGDHRQTAAAVSRVASMKSDDAAFLNEAMYRAAAELEESAKPSSRHVIVWLTDNLPNYPTSRHLQEQAKGLFGATPHTEAEAFASCMNRARW